jgi:hypothetical protein
MRSALLLVGCLLSDLLSAQGTLTCRVVDAETRSPLPYATVLVQGSTRGTITNAEGWFSLPIHGPSDSLRISFVGYRTRVVHLHAELDGRDIRMERAVHTLGEAVIRPGEDLYARVVAASNWMRAAPEVRSKLFYGMETHSDGQPVEVLNAWYNATLKGAVLEGLDLRSGSIGIAPKGERHFINFNTARAFALMDVHAEVGRFPLSPLAHRSARKLREAFTVEFVSSGHGADAVDHLRVVPRANTPGAFTLDLWLAAEGVEVRALELSCMECPRHPFVPLFPEGRIDAVDMRYRQSWTLQPPHMPEVMELDYHTTYSGPGFQDQFRTHAIMHAHDPGAPFIPALFQPRPGIEEYRMIRWLPRDTVMEQRLVAPIPTERQMRDRAFIEANDLSTNAWYDGLGHRYDLLRPAYVVWSRKDRIGIQHLRESPPEVASGHLPADRMKLRAQLYLAMDTTGGEFHYTSAAVFDGLRSMYAPTARPWIKAFLNIAFDLAEMEHRHMKERLDAPGMTVERARRIHAEHEARLRDTLDTYVRRTRRGGDMALLHQWNREVKEALGINNLMLVEPRQHVHDFLPLPTCASHPHLGLCDPTPCP